MEEVVQKPKRVMSDEALQKLAIAREKANAKRKELAAQRHEEKENIIQEKMEAVQKTRSEKISIAAEREAKKRLSAPKKMPSTKRSVVIERDESDESSSEDDIQNARVFFVRKNRTETPTPPAPVRANTLDPLDGIYNSMFGGSTNYL